MKMKSLKKRMPALEEAVKKSLGAQTGHLLLLATTGLGARPSYATVAAPPMKKTAMRIRVAGAEEIQLERLLAIAKEHITAAYAIRQKRS